MNSSTHFDYASLIKPGNPQVALNFAELFQRRMQHWVDMLEEQNEALRQEDAKLHRVNAAINFHFDFAVIRKLQAACVATGKLAAEVFDPTGNNRLVKIGELKLISPLASNKWGFYSGLRMSRNPDRNPALFARLEPLHVDFGTEARLPSLTLLPDTIQFTREWFLLEGSRQDIASAIILSSYDFGSRPNTQSVAQGLISVLLSSVQS